MTSFIAPFGPSSFRSRTTLARQSRRVPPVVQAQRSQRQPFTAQAQGSSGSSDFQTASGDTSSGMERIEYIIRPDGRVEELVTGVRGQDCVKVTQEINEKLGTVTSTEKTTDYYEENIVVNENIQKNIDSINSSW